MHFDLPQIVRKNPFVLIQFIINKKNTIQTHLQIPKIPLPSAHSHLTPERISGEALQAEHAFYKILSAFIV